MTKSIQHGATDQESSSKPPGKLPGALRILVVILFPVILVVALQRISIEHPLRVGEQAPTLTLNYLSAGTVSLKSPYRQRLVLLFFSADCPHCKKDLINMERLRKTFSGNIQFLLITRSDRAKTRALLDSLAISTPVAIDEEGKAQTAFGVFTVPALFLINNVGAIQTASFGERSFEVRKEQLESFLQATETRRPASAVQ